MAEHKRSARQLLTAFTAAASLLISSSPIAAFAHGGVGDINGTNDGQIIKGGVYYNTAGDKTTFQNSGGSGIYLGKGDTLTGKEVNGAGVMTGNGGNILINAPNQVVRLDGNVNANANSSGFNYIGNGGTVTVNTSFLYQNGQITANGINGGAVSFNVGSLTMGPLASIQATGHQTVDGLGGNGGTVNIKSPGTVDFNRGSIVDVSGKTIGTYDTNTIKISGGLVNMDGILTANGLYGSSGGSVQIAAVGATKALDYNAMVKADNFISVKERNDLMGKDSYFRHGTNNGAYSQDGNIIIGNFAKISANGSNGLNQKAFDCGCTINPVKGADGGKIVLEACKNLIQYGTLSANGGNAGSFVVPENGHPGQTTGNLQGANGLNGGNGGTIVLAYHGGLITRAGSVTEAKGGNAANGQDSHPLPGYIATGGKGGDGGNGGTIIVKGPELTNAAKSTFDVSGGQAGKEGNLGAACNSCTKPGLPGAPGTPGIIIHKQPTADCPYCAPGLPPGPPPVTPPTTPPNTTPPGQTIYPKEYPQLGGSLPGNVGPLVNYNRAVYMARSPLPLEKRVAVPPVVTPKPVPAPKFHKPAPAQRKIPVRGYW